MSRLKHAVGALTAAVLVAALAACGSSPSSRSGSSGGGGDHATVWMYPLIANPDQNNALWNSISKGFHAANPKMTVSVDQKSWASRDAGIPAAFASGSPPDLILMITDQIPQFAAQQDLVPVSSVLGSSSSQFRSTAIKGLSYNNDLYGVPLYVDSTTAMYNKKVFAAAGITSMPKTWAQMLADAPKLAAKHDYLFDYYGSPQQTLNQSFYPFLWEAGGQVFSKDGKKVVIDSPQGIAALSFLVKLEKAKGMPPDAATQEGATFGTTALARGKAGMIMSQDLPFAESFASAVGKQNVIVGMPMRETSSSKPLDYGNTGGLVLTKKASDPAAAKAFLRYVSSPKVESKIAKATGYFDPRTAAPVPSGALPSAFYKALSFDRPGDENTQARRVMSIIANSVQAALLGKQSPAEALKSAEQTANSEIANSNGG